MIVNHLLPQIVEFLEKWHATLTKQEATPNLVIMILVNGSFKYNPIT